MAQVGVQQPTNLMEMFSSPSMMLGDIAAQQVNDQTLGNLINRQQAGQDMDIQRQKMPFELARMGLENQEIGARIPGIQADSGLKQNNLKVDTANLDVRTKADLSKKLAEISDSDWTQHVNAIQQGMTDPSPQVRQIATQIYNQLPEMVKLREKAKLDQDSALALEDKRGQNQRELENNQFTHGKYLKPGTMSLGLRFNTLTDPIQIDSVARQLLADEALSNDDKQTILARWQANKPAYDAAMKAKTASLAGKPNAAELAGLPAVDIPSAQPPVVPGSQASAPDATPDKLQITPAAVQQAFGSYEPNKYQYRINPATGKLQRKPI